VTANERHKSWDCLVTAQAKAHPRWHLFCL